MSDLTRESTLSEPDKYGTIVVDPPWDYGKDAERWLPGFTGRNRRPIPYPAMSVDAISSLPVGRLAAKDALVWLWTTNAFLPAAFPILAGWGFTYRQTFVWNKTNASPMGGALAPNSAEYLLVGRRGTPICGRGVSSILTLPTLRGHSRKPDAFLDLVESVSPGPHLELFSRRNRLGWHTWGNEAIEHVGIL